MAIDKAVDSSVLDGYFSDIADAIRDKDGTQNTYTPAQMPTAIENIPTGGGADEYFYTSITSNTGNSASDKLVIIKKLPTLTVESNVTDLTYAFGYLPALVGPDLDIKGTVTGMANMFRSSILLVTAPNIDTSKTKNLNNMFSGCVNLVNVPLYNTSAAEYMNTMFSSCSSLSNDSLNNIMRMCINATNTYKSQKTLKGLGLSSAQVTTCQSLSNYQDFLNAGWTTGY